MELRLPAEEGRLSRTDSGAERMRNAPLTPDFAKLGALDDRAGAVASAQGDAGQQLAANDLENPGDLMHHEAVSGGEMGAELANQPAGKARLTAEEVTRVLTYVECGYSLRQAAAAIGRSHTTLLRLRQRSRDFDRQLRQRQELGREMPLQQMRQACQRSWRAAAWLLNYLDARERSPRSK